MAVRFTGTGQSYSSTSSPPDTTLTVTCWACLLGDRSDFSTVWASDQAAGATYLEMSTGDNGVSPSTTVCVFNTARAGFPISGPSMTIGTWYQLGFTLAAGTGTFYFAAAGSALASDAETGFGAVTSPVLTIGDDGFGGDWWNGRIANFKHYSAALTAAEVQAELAQYMPVRTTNLVRWHPFSSADPGDYSGAARTLSGGSGASTEDGPPIPWRLTPTPPASTAVRRAANF